MSVPSDRANKLKRLIESLETVKISCAQAAIRAEEYEKLVEEELKQITDKNKEALS